MKYVGPEVEAIVKFDLICPHCRLAFISMGNCLVCITDGCMNQNRKFKYPTLKLEDFDGSKC